MASFLNAAERELNIRRSRNRLAGYNPYAKQQEFHRLGATKRERLLMAANQVGKSYSGSAEDAYHLTGRYPEWWTGRRWNRPTRGWAASKTGEVTRDSVQRLLVGPPTEKAAWGTGLVPYETLVDWSMRSHVPDALASIMVRHVTGGLSYLGFKSYDQGREKWQAETLDFVHFDEEPPEDIYSEGLTRTNAAPGEEGGSDMGMVYLTFTPLLGMSDVVRMFLEDAGR